MHIAVLSTGNTFLYIHIHIHIAQGRIQRGGGQGAMAPPETVGLLCYVICLIGKCS